MIERCTTCHKRHEAGEECAEPSEEGYIRREELIDAFRRSDGVCLDCQAIWFIPDECGPCSAGCPACRQPFERFDEDDLPRSTCG